MNELSTKVTDTSAQQQEEGMEDAAGKSAGEEGEKSMMTTKIYSKLSRHCSTPQPGKTSPRAVGSPMSSTWTKHVTPTTIFKNG